MPTLFTRIIDGQIPATFVWKDDQCVAFMSINPMACGHTLVVPRQEVDHWVDGSAQLMQHLFSITHIVGVAQRLVFGCERVGVIVAGYEVPHTHIHVIPTSDMSQLSFANAAANVSRQSMEEAADLIRRALRDAGHRHCDW